MIKPCILLINLLYFITMEITLGTIMAHGTDTMDPHCILRMLRRNGSFADIGLNVNKDNSTLGPIREFRYDNYVEYRVGGIVHRPHGPSIIWVTSDGNRVWEWMLFGKYHRYYGPTTNLLSWWIHGELIWRPK